jgi:hypothetical protein
MDDEEEEVNDDEEIIFGLPTEVVSLDKIVQHFGEIDDYIKVNGVPDCDDFKVISNFRRLKQTFEAYHQ